MSEKKSKLIPILAVFAFVVIAIGLLLTMNGDPATVTEDVTAETLEGVADELQAVENAAEADGTDEDMASSPLPDNDVDVATLTTEQDAAPFDMAKALEPRILGNPSAPVKITEYSSFSCGHCGNFHRNVYADLKANWIDTGKAYVVFSDFPLNAPALHASLVGRCIADDAQYFAYVDEVFAKQSDWAYQTDHLGPLKAIAANYGIDGDMFAACIQNQELQDGLMARLRAAQQQFNVNSTPSFVINNAITIEGGSDYETFNRLLEEAIEASTSPAAGDDEMAP